MVCVLGCNFILKKKNLLLCKEAVQVNPGSAVCCQILVQLLDFRALPSPSVKIQTSTSRTGFPGKSNQADSTHLTHSAHMAPNILNSK